MRRADWEKAESQPVESPMVTERFLAILICREISRAKGGQKLKWAFLQSIEESLGLAEKAAQVAVRYGAERGWLLLEGHPVHSVILCDAATEIIDLRDPAVEPPVGYSPQWPPD